MSETQNKTADLELARVTSGAAGHRDGAVAASGHVKSLGKQEKLEGRGTGQPAEFLNFV